MNLVSRDNILNGFKPRSVLWGTIYPDDLLNHNL